MQFFQPKDYNSDTLVSQSTIDFMNENAAADTLDSPQSNLYQTIHQPFTNKSSWRPNRPNKTLDSFKRTFKMNLLEDTIHNKTKPNLTKDQCLSLLELRKNPHIVIKKADKGSAVVIMNTTDYLREGYNSVTQTFIPN